MTIDDVASILFLLFIILILGSAAIFAYYFGKDKKRPPKNRRFKTRKDKIKYMSIVFYLIPMPISMIAIIALELPKKVEIILLSLPFVIILVGFYIYTQMLTPRANKKDPATKANLEMMRNALIGFVIGIVLIILLGHKFGIY